MKELPINQIICGDCLKVMRDFPDKSVDLILTDPPYGVDLSYDTYVDTKENWFEMMDKVIPEMIRVAKMVIFPCCQINRLDWFYKNYPPRWLICWDKGSPGIRSPIGFNDYELLVVYGKNNPQNMHDLIRIHPNEKKGNYGHPCPKPIKWCEWIISRATKESDIVLDPFAGSGTTLVASKNLRRKYIGIELSSNYVEIIKNRLSQDLLF